MGQEFPLHRTYPHIRPPRHPGPTRRPRGDRALRTRFGESLIMSRTRRQLPRLRGASTPPTPGSRVRIGLEQLESRETPALFTALATATSSFSNASWAVL